MRNFPKLVIDTIAEYIGSSRYDGDYRVIGTCPNCGGHVEHIYEADTRNEQHRACEAGCQNGGYVYDARSPLLDVVITGERNHDAARARNLGFEGSGGRGLLVVIAEAETDERESA